MAELKQKRLRSREGHVYETREDRVFNVIVVAILAFSILIVAYPLIYVVSASFSSTEAVMAGRVWLLPVDLSLKAYETVFKYDEIMTGYKNALIYTVTGTAVSLVVTTLCAFCLSRKDFFGRKVVGFMVLFTMIFNAVGVIGGWVVGVVLIGSDSGAFWSHMQASVDVFEDIGNSVVKSVVFSAVAGLIALYEGYTARATPEGVSQATTRTVVVSSLMILGFDFIMTALMFAS